MNLRIELAVAAAALTLTSFASAGDLADACVAALEADGRDASGCGCLEDEAVAGDLVDEFIALGEIADPAERYEAASSEAKAAMNKCTR